ncbi:aminotransferase class I/II-fold pyridoxal phosphate-dependent enzyme [Algoriphagus aestuariicola]|uniref:Aminotransferase class I/II-fold pyridoxal phosphate-dependent enzyme n=1 Tax=Algoriphagus aestuariicola TaxID=1852016 RepID=A0ABS3BWL0_9BACT|nr:GntG family PLP-dependent aldolase [Algoriphagus aestuariicola]MBN7803450.1 aminotransferase class I/II-fold pyridoxal phosphate-dependent enzyme [Algoriphagus aestuariicola]
MLIDLRSDTVTRPTPGMKEAMFSAPIGDDVFGEDPTVNALEEKVAKLFGMEAAIFCPSGTMTNQIAIRLHTGPQREVVCHQHSHIYLYEGGGIMANSLASVKLLDGNLGKITASQVAAAINPDDVHATETALVSLENTMNKGGGSIYTLDEIKPIHALCREKGIKFHLDGARLFNALVETREKPFEWGAHFDTISICLSKGLGCPVGSILLGSKADIKRARKVRKVFGGGMRQAGFLAAAGIYALDYQVERLKEDHARAKALGQMLALLPIVSEVFPVATNIVIARLDGVTPEDFMKKLAEMDIKSVKFGPDLVRFVTHLDFIDEHLEEVGKRLGQL